MSNHEKLGRELGASQDDVAGIELNEEKLEQVAGGTETTILPICFPIIKDPAGDSAAPLSE